MYLTFIPGSPPKKRVRLASLDTVAISGGDLPANFARVPSIPSSPRRSTSNGFYTPTPTCFNPLPIRPRKRSVRNPEGLPEAKKIDKISKSSSVRARVSSFLGKNPHINSAQIQSVRRDIDSSWAIPLQTSSPTHSRDETTIFDKRDLIHRMFRNQGLDWDIRDSPQMANSFEQTNSSSIRFHSFIQMESAFCPNVQEVVIHLLDSRCWDLERKWGPIVLKQAQPYQPISVCHILEAIHVYFQVPLTHDDLWTFASTPENYECLEESWRRRNAGVTSTRGWSGSRYDPTIRRVDLLGDTKFRKLKVGSLVGTSCQLFLSLR